MTNEEAAKMAREAYRPFPNARNKAVKIQQDAGGTIGWRDVPPPTDERECHLQAQLVALMVADDGKLHAGTRTSIGGRMYRVVGA